MRSALARVISTGLLSTASFAFVGCETIPDQREVTRVAYEDIVKNIRCEIQEALAAYRDDSPFLTTNIGYEFDFKSEKTKEAGFGFRGVWPFRWNTNNKGAGTFTLQDPATGAMITKRRLGQGVFRAGETLKNIKLADCSSVHYRASFAYPVKGRIGIEKIIDRYYDLVRLNRVSVTDLVETIEFQTTLNAGLTPILFLRPVTGVARTFNVDVGLTRKRDDTHRLIVTLKPKADPPPPAKVVLVDGSQLEVTAIPTPTPPKPDDSISFAPADTELGRRQRAESERAVSERRRAKTSERERRNAATQRARRRPDTRRSPGGLSPEDKRALERSLDRATQRQISDELRRLDVIQ